MSSLAHTGRSSHPDHTHFIGQTQAKRRLEQQRAEEARPIPASRGKRLRESKRRLEEELQSECRANEAYEAYRARG